MISKCLLGGGLIAALVVGSHWYAYSAGANNTDAKWRAAADKARADHLDAIRAIEVVKQAQINEVSKDAKVTIAELESVAATVTTERDRLRLAAAEYAKRLSACSRATSGGQSPETPDNLLPNLLSRCASRVEELAGYADHLGVALTACRASYQLNAQ